VPYIVPTTIYLTTMQTWYVLIRVPRCQKSIWGLRSGVHGVMDTFAALWKLNTEVNEERRVLASKVLWKVHVDNFYSGSPQ
jgi:hypothetical protein